MEPIRSNNGYGDAELVAIAEDIVEQVLGPERDSKSYRIEKLKLFESMFAGLVCKKHHHACNVPEMSEDATQQINQFFTRDGQLKNLPKIVSECRHYDVHCSLTEVDFSDLTKRDNKLFGCFISCCRSSH